MLMDVVSGLLIAEDETRAVIVGLVSRRMKHVHLVLHLESSAVDAARYLEEERADIVLIEIGETEAHAIELLHALHKHGTPAVAIAMEDTEGLDERMLRAGASAFLVRSELSSELLDRTIRYALEHAAQKLEWMRLALFDPTVNVASRRMFDMRLQDEFRRASRCACPLSLILIDVDDFKQFNDNFGHLAGDECLRRVGETLRRCVHRVADLVARYGGEEFAAILPSSDSVEASQVAERMRSEVERLAAHEGHLQTSHVTISLGVACVIPDRTLDLERLVIDADRALYQAKKHGKNRQVLSHPILRRKEAVAT